jgi:hypothetical protein
MRRVTAFGYFCMVREDKNALKEAGVTIGINLKAPGFWF